MPTEDDSEKTLRTCRHHPFGCDASDRFMMERHQRPSVHCFEECEGICSHFSYLLKPDLARAGLLLRALFSVKRSLSAPPRLDREVGQQLCEEWNTLCPVGTEVRLFLTWGCWDDFLDTRTQGRAFVSIADGPVVSVMGIAGPVSLFHVDPLAIPEDASEIPF